MCCQRDEVGVEEAERSFSRGSRLSNSTHGQRQVGPDRPRSIATLELPPCFFTVSTKARSKRTCSKVELPDCLDRQIQSLYLSKTVRAHPRLSRVAERNSNHFVWSHLNLGITSMESKPGDLEGLAQTTGKAIEKEEPKSTTSMTLADPALEDVPDPDEDDLDDLDGL